MEVRNPTAEVSLLLGQRMASLLRDMYLPHHPLHPRGQEQQRAQPMAQGVYLRYAEEQQTLHPVSQLKVCNF
jgi:hypothetical protein